MNHRVDRVEVDGTQERDLGCSKERLSQQTARMKRAGPSRVVRDFHWPATCTKTNQHPWRGFQWISRSGSVCDIRDEDPSQSFPSVLRAVGASLNPGSGLSFPVNSGCSALEALSGSEAGQP